jgi:hypothetical protein
VGPETPVSPCSKSTMHHLIQVPCLHRGHHTGFPPFLYPSPSIFSIFPPLFPLCSIIAMPLLLPHYPSPPASLVCLSLLFLFPFLFIFFFSHCPPLLRLSCVPSSPVHHAPPFYFHLLSFVVFFFFFFGLSLQIIPHHWFLRPTLLHTRTTLDIHQKCRTKEMQHRKDR